MPNPSWDNRIFVQANQPPVLGADGSIPALRVPETFATFPGTVGNKIGNVTGGAIPPIPSSLTGWTNGVRRRASIGQTKTIAAVALARASHNARGLIGAIPRPRK